MKTLPPLLTAALIDSHRAISNAVGALHDRQRDMSELDPADIADLLRVLDSLSDGLRGVNRMLQRKRASEC